VLFLADLPSDEQLAGVRERLEAARARGQAFESIFPVIIATVERHPVASHIQRRERLARVAVLRDLTPVWQAAYERKPQPKRPEPPALGAIVPLDVGRLRWLFGWRQLKKKSCVTCQRSFWPITPRQLTCSEHCSRERERKCEREAARRYRRRRKARVPVST
jgi:hypothetical protein